MKSERWSSARHLPKKRAIVIRTPDFQTSDIFLPISFRWRSPPAETDEFWCKTERIALLLLVPAVFEMLGTRINYDMLDYLPVREVARLKENIQQIDHVESVLWYDSAARAWRSLRTCSVMILTVFQRG